MAILDSYNMALEVRFREYDPDRWLQYDLLFLYKGQSMANEALLKKTGGFYERRAHGAYRCNEYGGDTLIPTLEHVLAENRPASWTPLEPDAKIAFYPEMVFPFMRSTSTTHSYELIYESDESRLEREEHEMQKALFGKLPNDLFTVIAFADAYNFERGPIYTGSGPALILITHRQDVEDFLRQLKEEYAHFHKAWNLPLDPEEMNRKTRFKGKVISQDHIRKAVRTFEQQYLGSKEWAGWLDHPRTTYVLHCGNQQYPPKQILSLASGIPTADFNGGEQTNRVLRALGFEVKKK